MGTRPRLGIGEKGNLPEHGIPLQPVALVVSDPTPLRLTERRNPRTAGIDIATPLEIVDLIAAEDAGVPAAVARAREHIARALELVEASFRAGGRLIYVGAGTSGRLGVLDASECPPTFGTPPEMVIGVIAGGLCPSKLQIR
jgi:N-acetylmuramic acid 6-phosphate etherase